MSILCGTCTKRHGSIAEVRACAGVAATSRAAVSPRSNGNGILDRLRRQAGQAAPVGTYRQEAGTVRTRAAQRNETEIRPGWAGETYGPTPKAIKYATDRLRLREWEGRLDFETKQTATSLLNGGSVTAGACRELIDALGRCPYRPEHTERPAQMPATATAEPARTGKADRGFAARVRALRAQVPDSRYAVEVESDKLRFFLVKTNRKGYTTIKEYASDTLHDVAFSRYEAILQAIIDFDPEDAQVRFGQEMGCCYHCNRLLTDEVSRAFGIGPVCRRKGH